MDKVAENLEKARLAKAMATRELENISGINGIGLSRRGGGFAVKVNFESEPNVDIPKIIGGVEVIVEVVGKIQKRHLRPVLAAYHVEPHNGRWAIRKSGNRRVVSTYRTQREAIDAARQSVRKVGGDLVIHARDGSVRDRGSYAAATK